MIKPPKVATDVLVNVLLQAPPEPIICWLDSGCPTSKQMRQAGPPRAWLFIPYRVPRPSQSLAIASWKGGLSSAYRTRPQEWSTVFLLVLSIVVVTALSGIGVSLLFNGGIQVSSEKPDAANPSSDARVRDLLQVHRRRS